MAEETIVDNTEATQDPEAQKIIDNIEAGRGEFEEAETDDKGVELPSDEGEETVDDNGEEEKLYAGKYKTVDDLKNGVKNLNSTLSDTVLNGMSEEALESYYKELQSDFSKGKKHSIDEPTEEKEEVKDEKPKGAEGINQELWQELGTTFAEKGGITNEQYEKLAKAGIPEYVVDNYLDGIKARANAQTQEILEVTGGEDNAKAIKAWADENIDEEYIAHVNTLTGKALISAIKGIKAQYDATNNSGKRVVGNSGSKSSGAYTSQEAYLKDVSDPRYGRDEVFRKAVDKKLANSKL